jgi:hypothetical protein
MFLMNNAVEIYLHISPRFLASISEILLVEDIYGELNT